MSRECEIVRILQARIAGGDALPEERAQVDAHLKACSVCGKGRSAGAHARKTPALQRKRSAPPPNLSRHDVPTTPEPATTSPVTGLPLRLAAGGGAVIAVVGILVWLASAPDAAETGASAWAETPVAIPEPPREAMPTHDTGAARIVEPETEREPAEDIEQEPQPEAEPAHIEPTEAPPEPPAAESQPAPTVDHSTATDDATDCAGLGQSAANTRATPEQKAAALSSAGHCWQAAGDNVAALRSYERLLTNYPDTPSAPAAMFEKGVVCEALGRPGTASAAYATYRREHPNAPRMGEALYRLCRLHVAAGRREQALDCLQRYRLRYAHEGHLAETHYFEGLVLKDQPESLLAAAESFGRYAAGNDTELLDEALYWRAASLRQARDESYTAAAQTYLERMASGRHADEVRGWLGPE
ncbi:MAG: tetratricopeptide repeat protein [Myxococcota bacterium]